MEELNAWQKIKSKITLISFIGMFILLLVSVGYIVFTRKTESKRTEELNRTITELRANKQQTDELLAKSRECISNISRINSQSLELTEQSANYIGQGNNIIGQLRSVSQQLRSCISELRDYQQQTSKIIEEFSSGSNEPKGNSNESTNNK
jgi:ABC-type transporter Mla subunit MlaD